MIVILCKGCGAPFYAVSTITDDDVLEIACYAALGHQVTKKSAVTVEPCTCLPSKRRTVADKVQVYQEVGEVSGSFTGVRIDRLG